MSSQHPGSIIRERRLALCFKQERLAKALGVHQPTISRWERGGRVPMEQLDPLIRVLSLKQEQAARLETAVVSQFRQKAA